MTLFEQLLTARGLSGHARDAFLNPSYDAKHDPFLLPDMMKAVNRLVQARNNQEKITIYGDYDIDGLTATTVLLDAFDSFGFDNVDAFIPNRFVEGYGLTVDAVERIAATGAQLIVTVDCGSLSEKEIIRASELGVDVIVTDHHNVAPVQPPAIAVINPKRLLQEYPDEYQNYLLKSSSAMTGKVYPFLDLAGVGVAFKLIQALQTRLDGLEPGHEKWLLDLVALGTVCDIVTLVDENRANVFWGLKVLAQAKRPGLRALMAVAGVEPHMVNSRHLGFGLGPRMNAAGRLETAQFSLDMLRAKEPMQALEAAQKLDAMNVVRRADQDKIFKEAIIQAEEYKNDTVLVVSSPGWSHGIIGIVAAKLLEKYKKPTYVLEEMGDESKGSARSYGDFSVADAIRASDDIIIKGGGHKFAAGVTMATTDIPAFRQRVNEFYEQQKFVNQQNLLLPKADATVSMLSHINESFIVQLAQLEPFGSGNPEPILRAEKLLVINRRKMGAESQHVKLELRDESGSTMQFLAFNAPNHFFLEPGEHAAIWFQPTVNEWQGRRSIEGRLLHLELL
ncbi:single-stranded DNA exonuclease RecJ [Candidatus Saccharibacteria bacterium RIFCSPHIGHO2_01_FULL_45_15]|nr:MAG: single-stranded DNA exonuclease RecJ [Candidatus Saccharibacteria bacterium RIFCSPHIGHO2_01_FULL_45_15]OGL27687.1 MAG: single-stranded DNA exonuclease RecJ [Candidatus Saccharibacteria bacterium RIFCSPHIGHO2_02_FULL_46_12]OGL32067.1 MAG: single-stranded DNA exonuclease RecJ [Candidatus Saccharibacteria bacterium RIFCSPHIGHO2_12_FULL_44_22]